MNSPKDNEKTVTPEGGLPGLRGTDHIGFTVPNLEEAVTFFVEVLGCEELYAVGPVQADDDWMHKQLNVHPRAVFNNRLLRCKFGSNFEIFEYTAPDQNSNLPKNSDIGGFHLAFYVDDFDTALAYLKEQGLTILGEPVVRTEGPVAGQTWIYFLSPWGMQLELVSFPEGKGYEKHTTRRQWHTLCPGE
jgi:catechol 2,3-dioxygenase-like lactoylglutathione lyase family enzyme